MIMAVSSSFLSMGELDMSTSMVKGEKALTAAESCIEEGLRRIRLDVDYFATSKLINIRDVQCLLSISGSGTNRIVVGESEVNNYRKSVEVDITLNGREITINNWEEKSN